MVIPIEPSLRENHPAGECLHHDQSLDPDPFSTYILSKLSPIL